MRATLVMTILLFPTLSVAQESPIKVFLHSGTSIVGQSELKDWPIQTKYGKILIPTNEVKNIQFGLHYPDGLRDKLMKEVTRLNHAAYSQRESGSKELINSGKYAIPLLINYSGSLEAKERAHQILTKLREANTPEYNAYDIISSDQLETRGEVLIPELSLKHEDFGTIKIKLQSISKIVFNYKTQGDRTVEADGRWFNTEIYVEGSVKITADGTVDLWPAQAGTYQCGPRGHPSSSNGSPWAPGSLLGRIGEGGETFYVGDKVRYTSSTSGILYLRIMNSAWNNQSVGSYKVQVQRGE